MDLATPFDRASDRLRPIVSSPGFRLAFIERDGGKQGHAFAEFFRTELRLRLVWEGKEKVLWVESARQAGTQIVSRWIDVEWSVAGERLPLDRDVSDQRIERIASALDAYLNRIDWPGTTLRDPLHWQVSASGSSA